MSELENINKALLGEILSKFFETSFNAIVITSAEDGYPILYANPEFCRMTGYPLEELVGQSPVMLQGEKTSPKILQRLEKAIRAGKYFHGAAINYRKNGQEYPVEWNISPIFNNNGDVAYYLSIQKDLSALRGILSNFKQTNEQFRQFLSSLTRLGDGSEIAELQELLNAEKQKITPELIENSKLYSRSLRSDVNVELFDEDELFDCTNDTDGLFQENSAPVENITAQDYFDHNEQVYDTTHLMENVTGSIAQIDLIEATKNSGMDFVELGQNIQDVANDVFYFETFTDISSALGHLAVKTKEYANSDYNPVIIDIYRSLLEDLEAWVKTVFIDKTAENIHQYDASIISSSRQLLMFLK